MSDERCKCWDEPGTLDCPVCSTLKAPGELAAPAGLTVPFNEAKLDQLEKPTLIDGLICDLPDNRRVEVWRVKEEDGYFIRIFRPTNDGKTSKLVFGLKPVAATALMTLLLKQLSND
jgi:hypothetical protein